MNNNKTTSSVDSIEKQNENKDDNSQNLSAFVSIQRGCSNRCSFCIVPFTRGIERSRPYTSIIDEVRQLYHEEQVKEVTLLGQNVNSYYDSTMVSSSSGNSTHYQMSNDGFRSRINKNGVYYQGGYYFADLLDVLSSNQDNVSMPELRIRFTSPHPKDYPTELLQLMAERPNICNSLHMPLQSGSNHMLQVMKRGYTQEAYTRLIQDVWDIVGNGKAQDVGISSDFIAGFCDETEEDHRDTIKMMEYVKYDHAFMFAYSLREQTYASRSMTDNVSATNKQQRLQEIINTYQTTIQSKNEEHEIGQLRLILCEGRARRQQPPPPQQKNPHQHHNNDGNNNNNATSSSSSLWTGRTDQNKRVVFQVDDNSNNNNTNTSGINSSSSSSPPLLQNGDYAVVEITEAKGPALRGKYLYQTTLQQFHQQQQHQHENHHNHNRILFPADNYHNNYDTTSSLSRKSKIFKNIQS